MVQYSVTELFPLVWLLLWSAVFCVSEERFNSGNFTHTNIKAYETRENEGAALPQKERHHSMTSQPLFPNRLFAILLYFARFRMLGQE